MSMRLLLFACLVPVTFPGPLRAQVVINEVDADTPGRDAAEFVELYDGGVGATDLGGLVLVFFNGADDASYRAIGLDGQQTGPGGYFVVGNAALQPDLTIPDGALQNGPDAVALYRADAADFPNDTPLRLDGLVDAYVYGTADEDDAGLLPLLLAGQPQVDEAGQADREGHSCQRIPDGSGGGRHTATYRQRPPTPGAANAGGALPVVLVRFQALRRGPDVLLRWTTASETHSAGFHVERRRGQGAFEAIAFVPGAGTTSADQHYRFTDAAPFATRLAYRLRQVDHDGSERYSEALELSLNPPPAFTVHENYPDPFNPATTIRYELARAERVRIAVYDALGRQVARLVEGERSAGRHEVRFEAGGLPSGVYFYRVEVGTRVETRKMMLLK